MKTGWVWGLFCLALCATSGCRGPVEIIAHRGASYDAPENTLAAVRLGWERQADVEVDVYLSKDNRMVVIHDASTKRTARGVDLKVKETDAEELRKLDVGSFKDQKFAGERIPFLAEVIETVPPAQKLYIEIKCGKECIRCQRITARRCACHSQELSSFHDDPLHDRTA